MLGLKFLGVWKTFVWKRSFSNYSFIFNSNSFSIQTRVAVGCRNIRLQMLCFATPIFVAQPDVASQARIYGFVTFLWKVLGKIFGEDRHEASVQPNQKDKKTELGLRRMNLQKRQKLVLGPAVSMLWTLSKPETTRLKSDYEHGMTLPIAREDQKGCFHLHLTQTRRGWRLPFWGHALCAWVKVINWEIPWRCERETI